MCMMVYLASDYGLPEIKWERDITAFCIKRLDESDVAYSKIRELAHRVFIYRAGAYEGCGCGFSYNSGYPTADDIKEFRGLGEQERAEMIEDAEEADRKGRRSVEELLTYLRTHMPSGRSIDLYSYVIGKEGNSITSSEDVSLMDYSLGDSFCFNENQHIRYSQS